MGFKSLFVFSLAAFTGLVKDFQQNRPNITGLRFIDSYVVPFNLQFRGTIIGGLSGIDYDAGNNQFYLISDDRSGINPARFYRTQIRFSTSQIDSVVFMDVINILQPDGTQYPGNKKDPLHAPDPESIRYDRSSRQLVWTSEGDRMVRQNDSVLQNPSINMMGMDGGYVDSFPLPSNLKMHSSSRGPRQNGSLEGLTFSSDYKTIYTSMEEPLLEDGPRSDVKEHNATARIFRFDVGSKQNVAQYAYRLEPVAHNSFPPGTFKINGISEILAMGENQLLVVERSFSTGRLACTIKVFLADVDKASDVRDVASLADNPDILVMDKKLLLNMDELGIYIDNVEGVTLGPALPNGNQTLLFVTDNNFLEFEKTQLLWFEILP